MSPTPVIIFSSSKFFTNYKERRKKPVECINCGFSLFHAENGGLYRRLLLPNALNTNDILIEKISMHLVDVRFVFIRNIENIIHLLFISATYLISFLLLFVCSFGVLMRLYITMTPICNNIGNHQTALTRAQRGKIDN